MTEFNSFIADQSLRNLIGNHEPRVPGLSSTAYAALQPPPQAFSLSNSLGALQDSGHVPGILVRGNIDQNEVEYQSAITDETHEFWFEKIIVFPSELNIGNVLSSQIRDLFVYNNFRDDTQNWISFTNNVSAGVDVSGLPTLPTLLGSIQLIPLQVSISSQGPPSIAGALDFLFDAGLISVPITGSRVILFPFEPENPVRETLEFLTDLMVTANGDEQRMTLREAPRQIIEMIVREDSDLERDTMNALLFDWQARVFGVPIWWEANRLLADVVATGTSIPVDTAYADYRVGGLATLGTVYNDFETFEIVEVLADSLTILGEFGLDHKAGQTLVMPVRTAYMEKSLDQQRFFTGLQDTVLKFTTLDNADLASTTPFGTYKSKVLIDRFNSVSGSTVNEGYVRAVQRMDSGTGRIEQRSLWNKSKPQLALGLNGISMQTTWEIRQLMHALSGRRVSFYLGTAREDLQLLVDIPDSSIQIDIAFIDFTTFYQQVTPRSDIQITRVDGTVSQHEITDSSLITEGEVERLTLTPAITPALPVSEVKRIEFLTLSRMNSDEVTVIHNRKGDSRFRVPTIGVFA